MGKTSWRHSSGKLNREGTTRPLRQQKAPFNRRDTRSAEELKVGTGGGKLESGSLAPKQFASADEIGLKILDKSTNLSTNWYIIYF